jgi:hypothetical protein
VTTAKHHQFACCPSNKFVAAAGERRYRRIEKTHTTPIYHGRNIASTMTSTTAATLAPLEPLPAPYYSYWAVQVDTTDGNQPQSEGHKEDTDDDSPTQCGTCTSIDEEELKKYECAVCFEFMDTPVGCGSCQVRFCRPCLERVAKQGRASPKCSHCRAPFTLESIQVDDALLKEINNSTETVLCPFRGCGKKVTMNALKLHESQCGHITMKCKFSEWGW